MRYLVAVLLMLAMLAGWLAVQAMARRLARRHPELGEYREEGGGCCGACAGSACGKRNSNEDR